MVGRFCSLVANRRHLQIGYHEPVAFVDVEDGQHCGCVVEQCVSHCDEPVGFETIASKAG